MIPVEGIDSLSALVLLEIRTRREGTLLLHDVVEAFVAGK